MGRGRFHRAARFVVVVWAVALAFRALAVGVPALVSWAFNAGTIAPSLALPGVVPTCPGDLAARPPTPVDPALVRAVIWQLGRALGFATAARDVNDEGVIAGPLATLREERAPIAAVLGVPTPEVPPLMHRVDALHEFEVFLQADPGCIATRLGRTHGAAAGALYQFGATAGYVMFYRSRAPKLGPLFVPQLSAYGARAGIPAALWAPLAADLSSASGEQARQRLVGAMEEIRRYLLDHPADH